MHAKQVNRNHPNYPENKPVSSVPEERIVPPARTTRKKWQNRAIKKAEEKIRKRNYYAARRKLHAKKA